MIRPLVPLLLGLSLLACGPVSKTPRAADSLGAYLSALRGSDPRPVYDMLTREQRAATPYEEWAADWKETEPEREHRAQLLEETLRTTPILREEALLTFEDGKFLTLARDDRGWHLDQALVGRSAAKTPDDALAIFATAIHGRDLETVLRILSDRRRQGIEEQLQQFDRGLREHLGDAAHEIYLVATDRAEMSWRKDGVRYKVVLIREDGDWHVDDVHLGPDMTAPEEEPEESPESPQGIFDLRRRGR